MDENNLTHFIDSELKGPCEISNSTAAIPRFTHLSCYANVPLDDAVRAKTQCLTAFQASNPTCLVNIVSSGTGSFGCDVYFVYSFASKQCRLSYQSQEKTNTGCMLYQSLGLGKAAYRKNSTLSTNNYEC